MSHDHAVSQEIPPDHASRMAASAVLFKEKIAPLLREHCLDCHGGEKTKSAFSIANRESALKGGDQGVAIIPEKAKESPLIAYLTHREEPHMPPKKPRLPDEAIDQIEEWIQLGAAYAQPLIEGASESSEPMHVRPEDRDYWAYRPLTKIAVPDGLANPIDHFLTAEKPIIDRATLARRVWFDLIGLPPSPSEVQAFVADESPHAVEKIVDALLGNEHHGERWARHWLDVARFAESHGFEHDTDRPHAYHYRDFVIRALNADMPYDQFVRWQIAGDELAPEDPLALMATGFLGAGVFPTQITISEAERVRYDALDDMVATMGSAMLATTIGCARCHDHKYDPIPTRDYYALLNAFTATVRTEVKMDLSKLGQGKKTKVMFCGEAPGVKPMRLNTSSGKIPDFYKESYQLNRGDVNQKDAVATLGFLKVLTAEGVDMKHWQKDTTLRRTAVAHWLTDTAQGAGTLLARVIVNRLWQHHFGVGIVATPNDFGYQGEKPQHPELLEWLAGELVHSGWKLKHIHKLIVLSRAYQAHRPALRLDAEIIRDNALAVSGALDPTMYGPGTLDQSMKRRSIYF
ncbi:MAG: PSD1 and planctomycete cytochrome C domain-containing protein, partial [Verrucomicrobiales bacterium]